VSQTWGLGLVAVVAVSTAWLGETGSLDLYIHPRYIVFTLAMAAVAGVFVVGGLAVLRDGHDDDEIAEGLATESRFRRVGAVISVIVAAVVSVSVLIVSPTTLTSATVGQRDLNSSSGQAKTQDVATVGSLSSAAFARFTVLDWQSLLRQTSDPAFFSDKPVDVVGFVTADDDDPRNSFYVTRFVITCCAVDAQPVGVPVYSPGWSDAVSVDDWVQVTGSFASNPNPAGSVPIVLLPTDIRSVKEPGDPYLY
jgi:putative membrane protein